MNFFSIYIIADCYINFTIVSCLRRTIYSSTDIYSVIITITNSYTDNTVCGYNILVTANEEVS